MQVPRVAVLVGTKGRGSNMRALVEACQSGKVQASVSVVVTPRAETQAYQTAQNLQVPVEVLSPRSEDYGHSLLRVLKSRKIDWICLAGLMTKLPSEVLHAFPNRVLNIHPALLPKFGGKGMYGSHVHEAVLASHELESGCTVHIVTDEYDEGPILLQLRCEVKPDDTAEDLAARVLALEHEAYPLALQQVIEQHDRTQ